MDIPSPDSSPRQRPWIAGFTVALLGLAATALVSVTQLRSAQALAQLRFEQSADAFSDALARRLDSYTEIAFGLRGLFVVNPALGRREFVQAIERLDVASRHPEIKNLAFTRYVRGADKAAFEARVRADRSVEPQGYPQFQIRPPGVREEYFVADYLWPMTGNLGIHGLDISAQPANLASMRYARSSGQPVASGPFDLLQETTRRTGFVIRVPVFRQGSAAVSATTAPQDFLGAVGVTLRVWDVMESLRSEGRLTGLALYLSDRGPDYTDKGVNANLPLYLSPVGPDPSTHPAYRREFTVFGRKWRAEMAPAQPFLSDSEQRAPYLVALVGVLVSVLAAGGVTLALRGRRQGTA